MAWQRLVSLFADWVPSVEAWRKRRAELAPRSRPTYDAYPETPDPPGIRVYLEARDVRGRLRRTTVRLDGYSLHQINFRHEGRRDWFIGQVLEALIALSVKLDAEKEAKHG